MAKSIAEATPTGLVRILRERRFDSLGALVHAEAIAGLERTYAGMFVPALLQTEDYARHMLHLRGSTNPDDLLAIGMRRQQLVKQSGMKLVTVLDDAALSKEVGGPGVMRAQMERLKEEDDVRVIPRHVQHRASMLGNVTLLSDGCIGGVRAYREELHDIFVEDPVLSVEGEGLFAGLEAVALTSDESQATLERFELYYKGAERRLTNPYGS